MTLVHSAHLKPLGRFVFGGYFLPRGWGQQVDASAQDEGRERDTTSKDMHISHPTSLADFMGKLQTVPICTDLAWEEVIIFEMCGTEKRAMSDPKKRIWHPYLETLP
jgi:hypothetical protein